MNSDAQGFVFVRTFSQKLSDDGTFSLDLLRSVDSTVDSLKQLTDLVSVNASMAETVNERVKNCALANPIDPDQIAVGNVRSALRSMKTLESRLKGSLEAAHEDGELEDRHKESIIDAYQEGIKAAASLIEVMTDLCDGVERHDAGLNERIGPFKTLEELFARLEA